MFTDNFKICEWSDNSHTEIRSPEDTEPINAEIFCYKDILLAVHEICRGYRTSEYFTGKSIGGSDADTQIESMSKAMDTIDAYPAEYAKKRIEANIKDHGQYNHDIPEFKRRIEI